MSICPKLPDTWFKLLFRTLVLTDILLIASYVGAVGFGPEWYQDEVVRARLQFCLEINHWMGILIIVLAFFFFWKKPAYGFIGIIVGSLSIYLNTLRFETVKGV